MKKLFPRFVLMLFVLSLGLMAAAPMRVAGQAEGGDMSEVQLFLIGTVASAFIWLIRFARGRGWDPSNTLLTNLVFVASLVLALLFAKPVLPVFPPFVDLATFLPALLNYIGLLLVPLTSMVGFAVLIYNILLKKVLDGIGNAAKNALARKS